jgi:sugar phosphate isomerase/epimerase
MPELCLVKTLWGVTEMAAPSYGEVLWASLLGRIKSEGFDRLEVVEYMIRGWNGDRTAGAPFPLANFEAALSAAGLGIVLQAHTCGYPCQSASVDDHLVSLEETIKYANTLTGALAPKHINVHAGCDAWTHDQGMDFLRRAAALVAAQSIPVSFETHRVRLFWNAWAARDLLKACDSEGISVRLTADLSHWVVIAGRLMDHPSDAAVWPEILALVASHTDLIHARVGYVEKTLPPLLVLLVLLVLLLLLLLLLLP